MLTLEFRVHSTLCEFVLNEERRFALPHHSPPSQPVCLTLCLFLYVLSHLSLEQLEPFLSKARLK